jgi:hypothetical protein
MCFLHAFCFEPYLFLNILAHYYYYYYYYYYLKVRRRKQHEVGENCKMRCVFGELSGFFRFVTEASALQGC